MKTAIGEAVIRTLNGQVWKYFGGSFSTALAVFFFANRAFDVSLNVSVVYGVCFFVLLFFVRFLANVALILGERVWDRIHVSKFVKSIEHQKDAFAVLHDVKRKAPDDNEVMGSLVVVCDSLKSLFEGKTKTECSVSIKLIAKPSDGSGRAVVKNICRDSKSKVKRDSAAYAETAHFVEANTAFQNVIAKIVIGNRNVYYVNNSISRTRDYITTSRAAYGEMLPYDSELVVPIMPLKNLESRRAELRGYLCVDSKNNKVFDERIDPLFIQSVAEDVYDVIESLMMGGAK